MSEPFARAGIALALGGYQVLPVAPRAKRPLTTNGVRDATRDPETISAWAERWPNANVGVGCGASGICVLDVDSKGGADLQEILLRFPVNGAPVVMTGVAPAPDAKYPKSLQGVRGAQLFFRGDLVTTSALSIAGCEIRGRSSDPERAGAYVVVPPSVHPSGVAYGRSPARRRAAAGPGLGARSRGLRAAF